MRQRPKPLSDSTWPLMVDEMELFFAPCTSKLYFITAHYSQSVDHGSLYYTSLFFPFIQGVSWKISEISKFLSFDQIPFWDIWVINLGHHPQTSSSPLISLGLTCITARRLYILHVIHVNITTWAVASLQYQPYCNAEHIWTNNWDSEQGRGLFWKYAFPLNIKW